MFNEKNALVRTHVYEKDYVCEKRERRFHFVVICISTLTFESPITCSNEVEKAFPLTCSNVTNKDRIVSLLSVPTQPTVNFTIFQFLILNFIDFPNRSFGRAIGRSDHRPVTYRKSDYFCGVQVVEVGGLWFVICDLITLYSAMWCACV